MRCAGKRRLWREPGAVHEEHQRDGDVCCRADRRCGFAGGGNKRRQGDRCNKRAQERIDTANHSVQPHGRLRRLKTRPPFPRECELSYAPATLIFGP